MFVAAASSSPRRTKMVGGDWMGAVHGAATPFQLGMGFNTSMRTQQCGRLFSVCMGMHERARVVYWL